MRSIYKKQEFCVNGRENNRVDLIAGKESLSNDM